MIDFNETAAKLYPTMAQNAPVVPPVEPKPTTEPATTTPALQKAADSTRHTTTAQPTTTKHTTAGPYTLALPQDAVLEARAIERTTAFATAAGLSPEAAQKALEHANGEVAAYRDQETNAWNTLTRETWVNEVKQDPEIGGEKYNGAVQDAKRFLARFGDAEIRQFLDDTGFGNNKFVIRLFSRAARRMATDKPAPRAAGGRTQQDPATTLYGHTPRG